MGCEKGGSSPTKKVDDINILPNFNQVYGESLEDALARLNKLMILIYYLLRIRMFMENRSYTSTLIMVWHLGTKMF
jgi:hypothetical protein